jgi:glycosyltransferase involved in cell wall biosynthesis
MCIRDRWIIADGGSKDGTVELLKQNEDCISFWFSEPDRGIYDAWNKASSFIRGDWVLFLGAGDEFISKDTLAHIASFLSNAFPEHEMVFGNAKYISEITRAEIEKKVRSWTDMKGNWVFFRPELPDHATVFQHKSMFASAEPFKLSLKIAGDTEFLLKSIKRKEPLYCDVDISAILSGGVSSTLSNYFQMYAEVKKINKELNIITPFKHYLITMTKLIMKVLASKCLPKSTTFKFMDFCRAMQGLPKKWTIT